MNFAQTLSLVLLLACLVLAVWRRINIGVLALAACLVILAVSGADSKEMYKAFPGSVFTLIVGVSLLFAHLEKSGAIQAFVGAVFRLVGDRTWLLPWTCFAIGAAFTSVGAFSTAPIALLVPVVAYVSMRSPRSFFINEMAVVIGANCAGLSPLNPTGAAVRTAMGKHNVVYHQWGLWAISIVVSAIVVGVLQVVDAARSRRSGQFLEPATVAAAGDDPRATVELNRPYAIASGLGLLAFVVAAVILKWDVGVSAFFVALLLQLAFRPNEGEIIRRVPWNAVLLLCGLLLYLGLVQQIGTMDQIEKALHHVGSAGLLILLLAYMTALLCNIESSTLGVLTLMAPIVATSMGTSPALLLVLAAVCVPAALTVMNPVHVAGTLVIANTAESQQPAAFGRLFGLSVTLSCIVPGLMALLAIAVK